MRKINKNDCDIFATINKTISAKNTKSISEIKVELVFEEISVSEKQHVFSRTPTKLGLISNDEVEKVIDELIKNCLIKINIKAERVYKNIIKFNTSILK